MSDTVILFPRSARVRRAAIEGRYLWGQLDTKVRPPRRARLVCRAEWSWSPAHGRTEEYWLALDRNRRWWTLWVKALMDNGVLCGEIADCAYIRAERAEVAAALLLTAWRGERDAGEWDGARAADLWAEPGLLTTEQVEAIAAEVDADEE